MREFDEQTRDFKYAPPLDAGELQIMLGNTERVLPNFEIDSYNDTAHRFEKLKAIYEKNKNVTREKRVKKLRNRENALRNTKAVNRAFDLMAQFVYNARQKLAYGQSLRMQYGSTIEYKIGYCFALMRDIRQQQLVLYSTMYFKFKQDIAIRYSPPASYEKAHIWYYFEIYEKFVRLELDMKDVANLAQKLMDMRWKDPKSTTKGPIYK